MGKDTLIARVVAALEKDHPGQVSKAVYTVTRPLRGKEKQGIDVNHVSTEEFESMKEKGEFSHNALFPGYQVGSPWSELNKSEIVVSNTLIANANELYDLLIKRGDKCLRIYLKAPKGDLKRRVLSSGRESFPIINNVEARIERDKELDRPEEIAKADMIIENREGNLEGAVTEALNRIKEFLDGYSD